jgi:hypothetical protein
MKQPKQGFDEKRPAFPRIQADHFNTQVNQVFERDIKIELTRSA